MRLLQQNLWPRHAFPLLLLWLLLGLLLNGCGITPSLPGGPCEANPGPSPVPGLAVVDQSVYLLSSGTRSLFALRVNDGTAQWRDPAPFWGGLIGENERVYLHNPDYDGSLSVLQAGDGKLLWSKSTGDYYPQIADGSVYLNQQGSFIVLDGSNGSLRWTNEHFSFVSLQGVDGVVYLLDGEGQVHALSEETGVQIWQASLDHVKPYVPNEPEYAEPPYARLEVLNGVVYVQTDQLYALRVGDGHELWRFPLNVGNGSSNPNGLTYPLEFEVAHGVVYFLFQGHLMALQASDGKLLWQSQGKVEYSTFFVASGLIYASRGGANPPGPINFASNTFPLTIQLDTAHPLDALQASTGHLLWRFHTTQSLILRSWASQGSILYLLIASQEDWDNPAATLMALQGNTGKTLWSQPVGATALLLDGGALYAGFAGNSTSSCAPQNADEITKFDAVNGSLIWHKQL